MSEMKSLMLNGTKYDSFVDQTAREMAQNGGNGPTLPLLYEVTTTEEVRWIDTGDHAITVNNMIVIELLSLATATNEADKPISCSVYTDDLKPVAPWTNSALLYGTASSNVGMPKQYDKLIRIIGIAGNNGDWTSIFTMRNYVNSTPQTAYMHNGTTKGSIKGIIIGDSSAQAGTRVFGAGTTLKVWGC